MPAPSSRSNCKVRKDTSGWAVGSVKCESMTHGIREFRPPNPDCILEPGRDIPNMSLCLSLSSFFSVRSLFSIKRRESQTTQSQCLHRVFFTFTYRCLLCQSQNRLNCITVGGGDFNPDCSRPPIPFHVFKVLELSNPSFLFRIVVESNPAAAWWVRLASRYCMIVL